MERADGVRFWGLQLTEVAEQSQVSQLIAALMLPMRNAGWEFVIIVIFKYVWPIWTSYMFTKTTANWSKVQFKSKGHSWPAYISPDVPAPSNSDWTLRNTWDRMEGWLAGSFVKVGGVGGCVCQPWAVLRKSGVRSWHCGAFPKLSCTTCVTENRRMRSISIWKPWPVKERKTW